MTNKEKATALMAIVGDEARTVGERQAAWAEIDALKKQAKCSYEKLGVMPAWQEAMAKSIAAQVLALPEADPLDEPLKIVGDQLQHADGTPVEGVLSVEFVPGPVSEAIMPEVLAKDPAAPAKALDAQARGQISAAVRRLLEETDQTYAEIAEAVRAEHPSAKTTSRSIASVAADMRKAGRKVGIRRAPARAAAK